MEHFIKNLLYLVLMIAVLLFGLTITIGSMIAYNRFVNTPKEPTQVDIKTKMPERTTSVSVVKNKDLEKLGNARKHRLIASHKETNDILEIIAEQLIEINEKLEDLQDNEN